MRVRVLASLIGSVVLSGVLATVSPGPAAAAHGSSSAPMAIPLTSGVANANGASVTLAMGHLGDPADTFWELFLRPAGSAAWSLHTPPGVADNGGLVVSAPAAGPLTVGFLPSASLRFSPVAQSDDGGKSWSPGFLPTALVPLPDGLASAPAVGAASPPTVVALVTDAGEEMLAGQSGLSSWHSVVTKGALAHSVRGCSVTRITAVAVGPSGPVLGVQCAQPGRVGVLVSSSAHGWLSDGPVQTGGGSGSVTVIRLADTVSGLAGLAGVRSVSGTSLVAFWDRALPVGWSQSAPLAVPSGWVAQATATGGGAGAGLTVLLGNGARRRIAAIAGPGSGWVTLPAPPTGTAAVAGVGGETDAFVVAGSRLTVWTWSAGDAGWHRSQTVSVPIPYGSSN